MSPSLVSAQVDAMQCVGLCAALTVVEAELPVVSDREAARQAKMLLDACMAAQALEWVFALALALDYGPALAGMCEWVTGQLSLLLFCL